jgi:hypothetical protein
MTVRAVMCQKGFTSVVKDAVAWVASMNDPRIICIYCKTGYHRADVTGKTVTAVLNAVAPRTFNALHLSICRDGPDDIPHSVATGLKWIQAPWCNVDLSGEQIWRLKEQAITRPESWTAICALEDYSYNTNNNNQKKHEHRTTNQKTTNKHEHQTTKQKATNTSCRTSLYTMAMQPVGLSMSRRSKPRRSKPRRQSHHMQSRTSHQPRSPGPCSSSC